MDDRGTVVWLCLPRFDAPSVFASILDPTRGGHWTIAPSESSRSRDRRYVADTLVLETVFTTEDAEVMITDCMPLAPTFDLDDPTPIRSDNAVVRKVRGLSGRTRMRLEFVPRFGYGESAAALAPFEGGLEATGGGLTLHLRSPVDLEIHEGVARADFTVGEGDEVAFVLQLDDGGAHLQIEDASFAIEQTVTFWKKWLSQAKYAGRWKEEVKRSLAVLKGLTYSPTGGIVAAPTTSLPEDIGGERNWDYRFCWLRDATFTLGVLLDQGYTAEAIEWRDWLCKTLHNNPGEIQPLYSVTGETDLKERELPWLDGYEGSRPVRSGNAASEQFQLDVYGEILDAMHSSRRAGIPTSPGDWEMERKLVERVIDRWQEPDASIWEVRGPLQHFVHSKVMAWVAMDRAVAAVDRFSLDGDRDHWSAVRDEIRAEVMVQGVDPDRHCFKRSYEDGQLDASLLLLPMVGFVDATDPIMVNTIEAIEKDLVHDGLVKRYLSGDGLKGTEGTFLICTCWLVDDLVMIGRRDDATAYFERMLSVSNDLDLMAEEYDPAENRMLGNFPQGFSHTAVITAAVALETKGHSPLIRRHEPEPRT